MCGSNFYESDVSCANLGTFAHLTVYVLFLQIVDSNTQLVATSVLGFSRTLLGSMWCNVKWVIQCLVQVPKISYFCKSINCTQMFSSINMSQVITLQIYTTRLRWNFSHSSQYDHSMYYDRSTQYDEWLEFHRNLVIYICSVVV